MSDDKTKQGYQDDSKIANDELSYWRKALGVSRKKIIRLMKELKTRAVSKIRLYIKSHRNIP